MISTVSLKVRRCHRRFRRCHIDGFIEGATELGGFDDVIEGSTEHVGFDGVIEGAVVS